MCRGGQGGLGTHTGGTFSPRIFRGRALALSPRSTFKPLGGVEVERFFGGGHPSQFSKPCGAAAVLPSFGGRSGVLPKPA